MKTIKLISSIRESLYTVLVTYSHEDTQFTVKWSNVLSDGKLDEYDLELETQSSNCDFAAMIDEAIRRGEDGGKLDAFYLVIRDTFDALDCEQLSYSECYSELVVTETSQVPSTNGLAVNFTVNDYLLIQYDNGVFSIPTSAGQYWDDGKMQDIAHCHFDLDAVVTELELKEKIELIKKDN